jgi:hypothetical protein
MSSLCRKWGLPGSSLRPQIKPQEKETSDMHPDPAAAAPAMLGEEDTKEWRMMQKSHPG